MEVSPINIDNDNHVAVELDIFHSCTEHVGVRNHFIE